jgi:hypothetical protein
VRIVLARDGLYVVFRHAADARPALGFAVKPRTHMFFSERYGCYRRAFTLGPLYFRTYARRAA